MASFNTLSPDRIAELTRRAPHVSKLDLSQYRNAVLDAVEYSGHWGEVRIDQDDNRRTEKRRLSIAGRLEGFRIRWHSSSTDQTLVYRAVPISNGSDAKAA